MKHLISLFGVLLVAIMSLQAEVKMKIQYLNGTEYTEVVSAIARWEIDGKNELFRLIALDGTLLAEKNLYDDIRRIVFFDDNGNTGVNLENKHQVVAVYPNPTATTLNIEGVKQGETIRIFSLDGQILISETAGGASLTVDVQGLDMGVYLLQIGTEFVKIIKQ